MAFISFLSGQTLETSKLTKKAPHYSGWWCISSQLSENGLLVVLTLMLLPKGRSEAITGNLGLAPGDLRTVSMTHI